MENLKPVARSYAMPAVPEGELVRSRPRKPSHKRFSGTLDSGVLHYFNN
jgi:hypothetical protein